MLRFTIFFFIIAIVFIDCSTQNTPNDDKNSPYVICEPDTACTCTPDETAKVNCDNVVWTENEEGEEIYSPLRTTNLKITKKNFVPEIATFRNNDIPRLTEGEILPGHETTLKELDFTYNRIYRFDKSPFKKMTNLRVLRLGHNKLVRLTSTAFKGGPSWKLHQLYLEYNNLHEIPTIFNEMPNLEKLVLDGNRKMNLTKAHFGSNLDRLKILSLDNCGLSKLPDKLFDDLISLEQLSLRNNPFTEIPKALNDIPSLIWLDISDTEVTELQSFSFSKNKQLKNLIMENLTYLYIIHDCAFCGLKELEEVALSNATELYMINESAFGWNHSDVVEPKLISFDVQFTNLTTLSSNLLDTVRMEVLKLGGNKWNCNCDLLWVLAADIDLNQGTKAPLCAQPSALEGRTITSLSIREMCPGRLRVDRLILSLFMLITASLIVMLLYYVLTNYRLRNVFYRPDMPHIAYSSLNRAEEEERRRKAMEQTQQVPPPPANV